MKNIVRIITISKPLYKVMEAIGVLIVITALLDLVSPILSKFIVDQIVLHVQHKGGNINTLAELIALTFAVSIMSLILTTFSDRLGDHFAGKLRKFLTEKFYEKVLTLPQSYFDSEISGKIVNQLNRGIFVIQTFLNSTSNFILPTFLQSIFTVIVLARYNLPIAFFTFILFPIYLVLSFYSSKRWGREEQRKNKIEDISRGRMSEVVANMSLVKSFNRENYEFRFTQDSLSRINKIYAGQSKTYHLFDFFRGLSLNIILVLISIFVFYNTYIGVLSIGELVLIIQLVNQARRPLFAMSFILTNIQLAENGSKEFFEILELPSKDHFHKIGVIEKIKDPTIRFKNVSFKYKKSGVVLENVSFETAKNEIVALVGHSGAGKSTIVNLILKFYDPEKGYLFLKNKNYKDLDQTVIRDNIALVFQENELFSSTIKENVLYGKEDAADEEVVNALKQANAYEFVQKLPEGMNSEIGERGVRLSGGEKQRVQIARAILKNAPILILDEATSSLDAKSEKEVHDALENLMKNKLVIIIAHRFSTIQNVSKIIVLDKGTIVDFGTPQELANRPGIYSDLLKFQIEGNQKLLEKFEIY